MQETMTKLKPETLTALQELIAVNTDSAKGFTQAAEIVKDESLARLFRRLGTERSVFASDLSRYVRWNDEEPKDDGTFRGRMHRWWTGFRGTVENGDPRAILEEAERGEDHIKQRYESVLEESPGTAMSPTLHSQYAAVCKAHDRIRDLRDATPVY